MNVPPRGASTQPNAAPARNRKVAGRRLFAIQQRLFHDANRLFRFGDKIRNRAYPVAFPAPLGTSNSIFRNPNRVAPFANRARSRCARNRSKQAIGHCVLMRDDSHFFERSQKTAGNTQTLFEFVQLFQRVLRFSSARRQAYFGKSHSNPPNASKPNK